MSLSLHHFTFSVRAWTADHPKHQQSALRSPFLHCAASLVNTRSDDVSVAGMARIQRTTADSFGHTADLSGQLGQDVIWSVAAGHVGIQLVRTAWAGFLHGQQRMPLHCCWQWTSRRKSRNKTVTKWKISCHKDMRKELFLNFCNQWPWPLIFWPQSYLTVHSCIE